MGNCLSVGRKESESVSQVKQATQASNTDRSGQSTEPRPSKESIKFRYEGGRRFHNDDKSAAYMLPNDAEEAKRLSRNHWALKEVLGGDIFKAPIEKSLSRGIKVLDVGCGPGTWILDMAKQYPESEFYGIDISPIFPDEVKLDNVHFYVGNVLERLPFPDDYFDFIIQRFLMVAFTEENWDFDMKELGRVVKSGGFIELHETEMASHSGGPIYEDLMGSVRQGMIGRGLNPDIALELPALLSKTTTGTILPASECVPMAIGWNGVVGRLSWEAMRNALQAMKVWQVKVRGISPGEWESKIEQCEAECREHMTYLGQHWAYAQITKAPNSSSQSV